MPKFKMLVFSNVAKGGDEANYNKWYNEQHIPDVCNVPGFTGAQRFKRSGDEGPAQYLAIYEMDADDPAAVVAELTSRAGTDKMVMTDDIDLESATIFMYEQVSEPYTA